MSSNKRPSFQFYPADWLRDTALRTCSEGARGVWMDMLCYMHEGSPYGYLKVNGKVILPETLARMVGCPVEAVEGYLDELTSAGVAKQDLEGCFYSKRLVKDERIRQARAAGGFKGGNPNLIKGKDNLDDNLNDETEDNQEPTPSSSTSSSTSSSNKNTYTDEFEAVWSAYPKREGSNPKNKAFSAWKARLKEKVDPKEIAAGVLRYAQYCQQKGMINTGYVMQAARFFGPGKEYENDWQINPGPGPTGSSAGSGTSGSSSTVGRNSQKARDFRNRLEEEENSLPEEND